MNCYFCKGVDSVEERTTRYCACDIPRPFIVENVPAFVCRLCGDQSFSGETVTELEKIKNGEARVSNLQVFRVFDYAHLDQAPYEAFDPVAQVHDYPVAIIGFTRASDKVLDLHSFAGYARDTVTYEPIEWAEMLTRINTKIQLGQAWMDVPTAYPSNLTGVNSIRITRSPGWERSQTWEGIRLASSLSRE